MSKVLIVEDEEAIADIEKDYLDAKMVQADLQKHLTENMTSAYLMLCFRELMDLRYARR